MKAIRDLTAGGDRVFHSTALMFRYHAGARSGSAANHETTGGRAMTWSSRRRRS
jgi:hypothetical protein